MACRRRILLLALVCGCWPGQAPAQAATTPNLSELLQHARFTVREFVIEGNTLVPTADLQSVLLPFLGSGKSFQDLGGARRALLDAYARAGHEMVSIDYEDFASRGGVHRFRVREVRVERVRVTGTQALEDSAVRAQLPSLREDSTPALGRLARELFLFNDNPGRNAVIDYTAAGAGRVNAEVRVSEGPQGRVALAYNNTGSVQTGRSRLILSASHYNLFGASHQGSFSLVSSPEGPQKVLQLAASYAIPLPRFGDMLSFSASHARVKVGTVADVFSIAGESDTWNLRYARNLFRTAEARHVLEFGYDERRYRDLVDFFGVNLGASVTAKPLSLAYRMQRSGPQDSVQFGLTVQRNVPGGARNDDAAYAASRAGADARWTSVQLEAGWQHALPGKWLLSARLAGQYANEPLIAAEQFGLGGASGVRGFAEREGAGDRGVRGSLEVGTPVIGGAHRFIAFADTGRTSRRNALPGESAGAGLRSIGIGWRATLGKDLQLTLDAARVVEGTARFPSGSTRVHANAVLAF